MTLTRGRVFLAAGTALALVFLATAALRVSRSLGAPPVGTITATRSKFVREVVASGVLKAVRATPIIAPAEVQRAQKVAFLARDGAVVKAGEVVIRFDPAEAEREAADGRDDLASARGKIEKAGAEGGKTRKSLLLERDLAREELDRARTFELKDPGLYSRHQILESTLDRDLQEKKAGAAEKRFETSDKLGAAGVALGRIEADKATLRLGQAEKSLKSLTIEAPHDGLFVLVRGWAEETTFVGDTLWPGEKVAEIPDLRDLEARAYALEADAAGLQPGLACRLVIEGRPGETHEANVASVQPVARPRDRGSPVKFFEMTLRLEHTDPKVMRPGQKIEAVIGLEEIEGVIAIPRGALLEKDGRRIVFCRRDGRFVPVEVAVGPNSISRVVITSGIGPGDVVALRDPTEKAARLARAGGGASREANP